MDAANNETPVARESVAPYPTDRETNGRKRSRFVDEHGVLQSIAVSEATRHDSAILETLLKERMTISMESETVVRNLCLDAGYAGREDVVNAYDFVARLLLRGEEKQLVEKDPSFKARRWAGEAARSWFNRFRNLTPLYEKTDDSDAALSMFASAMIALNKAITLYG